MHEMAVQWIYDPVHHYNKTAYTSLSRKRLQVIQVAVTLGV